MQNSQWNMSWSILNTMILVALLGFPPKLSAATLPSPPNVRVTPGDGSALIAWDPVPAATSYHVKYTNRRSGQLQIVGTNITDTSWRHEGIRNGRRAYYAVSAVNASGESVDSPQLQVLPSEPVLNWLPSGTKIERLATRMIFTEGPVWNPAEGGFLIFSDINANRLYQWTFAQGLEVFRAPSENANGNTLDLSGRLITCEHRTRRITRTEPDGSIVPIIENHDGNKFNSPNDAVVKSDGTIWFTDPTWGLTGRKEMDGQYVYRHDPTSQSTTRVADGFSQPNGLCFSPDESILYVAESAGPLNVRAFDVQADGTLTNDRIFANPNGTPDGMRVDADGRLYVTAEDVFIYNPDGSLAARIDIPEIPANIAFGGPNNEMMFVTARTSLYGITRRPDLVISAIHTIPEDPSHGDTVTFQAVVNNAGTGPTHHPFTISFEIEGNPNSQATATYTGVLAPGASVLVGLDESGQPSTLRLPAGVQSIEANIAFDQENLESNRENNTRALRVTVAPRQPLRPYRDPMTGIIQLQVVGLPGEQVPIQTSSNLIEWTDWQTVEIKPTAPTTLDLPDTTAPHQFYRVPPQE